MNYQNWHGFVDDRFGYGAMLSGFLSAVPEDVKISGRSSVDVNMAVPFNTKGWLEGAHRVLFTMWETTQLPDSFVRWLDQYDQILVPCQHNVEVFSPHHADVSHVPLGVDTQWWVPCLRGRSGKFTVRGGGSLWARKGLDALVEAFLRARLPDAELEIKAAPHASDVPKVPEWVKLNREWMSKDQLREWFWGADLFVAPARGEGFGLIPLQAIAAGVPTIITATSGQAQFAHLATGVVSHRPQPSPLGGKWDEPNVDELADLIRDAHSNYQRWRETALEKAVLVDEFSWARASRKLADAVPEGRQLGPAKRVEPRVQFTVQVSRDCAVEVNGRRQTFMPGVPYDVTENTCDILAKSGYLVR